MFLFSSCSTINPLFPDSSIRPYFETSVNKNWESNYCERIAVVNLKYRDIPSLEYQFKNSIFDKYGYGKNVESMITKVQRDSSHLKRRNQMEENTRSDMFDSYSRNFLLLGFDVVDRNNIEELFVEMAISMTGAVDENSIVEVGKLFSADCVCLIDVKVLNGKFLLPPDLSKSFYQESFKVTKVETGQIVFQGTFINAKYGRKLMFNDLKKKVLKKNE